MSEMQTMETGATTTESGAVSQAPQSMEATADKLYGDQQQQSGEQEQQSSEQTGENAGQEAGEQEQSEQGAPEQYADFKAPEGQQFDPEVIKEFAEVAKDLNLSQEAAQKMLDKMAPTVAQRQVQQLEALRGQWAEQSTADKEFGGDKLQENLGVARKALDTFGSTELKSLLNESGLGNHPEFIRLLYRAGKAISEDSFVGGAPAGGSKPKATSNADYASSLYPSQQ